MKTVMYAGVLPVLLCSGVSANQVCSAYTKETLSHSDVTISLTVDTSMLVCRGATPNSPSDHSKPEIGSECVSLLAGDG